MRYVGNQADGHAGAFRGALHEGPLASSSPLQEEVEIHRILMLAREGLHAKVARILILLRPLLPVRGSQMRVQRLKVRVVAQADAPVDAIRTKIVQQHLGGGVSKRRLQQTVM